MLTEIKSSHEALCRELVNCEIHLIIMYTKQDKKLINSVLCVYNKRNGITGCLLEFKECITKVSAFCGE